MQILKEHIQADILGSAKKLFLERGFRGTKMRDIAEAAGISTSNLYNYFPSKEDLFSAIVDRAARHTMAIVKRYEHNVDVSGKDEIISHMVQEIYELMSGEQESLILVLAHAEDTKYGDLPQQVIEALAGKFLRLLKKTGATALTGSMLANNLFASMVYILKNCGSKEEIHENLKFLFDYHIAGILTLVEQ